MVAYEGQGKARQGEALVLPRRAGRGMRGEESYCILCFHDLFIGSIKYSVSYD